VGWFRRNRDALFVALVTSVVVAVVNAVVLDVAPVTIDALTAASWLFRPTRLPPVLLLPLLVVSVLSLRRRR
jgi:hypothetical protein